MGDYIDPAFIDEGASYGLNGGDIPVYPSGGFDIQGTRPVVGIDGVIYYLDVEGRIVGHN